jgi:hypothetical protein
VSNPFRFPPMLARNVAASTGPNPGTLNKISAASCCRKRSGELGVELDEITIDRGNLGGESNHQSGADRFGRQGRELLVGGVDGRRGDSGAVATAAFA